MSDGWADFLLDIVLSPAIWFSVALALTYSLLFHLWRGGGWRQLGRDLLAGLAGFGAGQLIGSLLGLRVLQVGQVQVLGGTLGAVLALILARPRTAGPG